jgi:hypothetical protein
VECGGPPPLSRARHAEEVVETFVRPKAVLKSPQSRRWRDRPHGLQTARSVWIGVVKRAYYRGLKKSLSKNVND